MANIATITNNIISALSGTTSQVLLGDATLTDFKLDSLTDVNVPTPGDGDVLKWNGTTLLWEASDSAGITGSGTTNYLPKFTGASTLGNSLLQEGTNAIGLGSTPSVWDGVYKSLQIAQASFTGATLWTWLANNWVGTASGNRYIVDGFATLYEQRTGEHRWLNAPSGLTGGAITFTQAMTLDASGRLGIGTNAPTESMQIVGGNLLIDNNRAIRTKNTGGSNLDIIKADTTNNVIFGSLFLGGGLYSYTNTSFRWFQYPSSVATERMQLSSLGNLLIGSSGDNGLRFQVTGNSSFSDNIGIGGLSSAARIINISKNITGAVTAFGIAQVNNVVNDVTNSARVYYSEVGTVAASFALSEIVHYYAVQGTFGAGSNVTNQYGYRVYENLTGATYNYGFYGNIPSGTNRWNLYMNGTANNYLAGATSIGTLNANANFNVSGDILVVKGTGVGSGANIYLGSTEFNNASYWNSAPGIGAVYSTTSTVASDLAFYTWAGSQNSRTERARFFYTGNLAIGTSPTDSGEKLQVNGTMKVTGASTFGGSLFMQAPAGVGTYVSFKNDSNTAGFDIGHLNGAGAGAYIYQRANQPLIFGTNNATALTIASTGAATFSSSVTATAYLVTPNGTNAVYNVVNATSSYAGKYVMQAGGGSAGFGGAFVAFGHSHATKPGWVTAGISAGSGGKFSVNISALADSTEVFTVDGNGAGLFNSSIQAATAIAIGTTPDVLFPLKVGSLMTVSSTGNVGINQTNPTSKLHVVGTTYLLGNVTTEGTQRIINSNNLRFTKSSVDSIYFADIWFSSTDSLQISSVTNSIKLGGGGPTAFTEYIGIASGGATTFVSTATAASFIPTSSTAPSNGIYLPAANSVAISTNSTNRLSVSSLGVVKVANLAGSGTAIVITDNAGNLSTQPTSTYLTSLSGEATNSGSAVTLTNSAVIGKVLTGLNVYSAAIAATDSILAAFGKIQGQIDGLQGGTIYKGSWNASTNTPTITSGTGTQGNYYVVTTAGTTTIDGVSSWAVGDWIIFNGTVWEKIPNVDAITSVNGQTGVVSLTTSNINEGTNLYYTDTRARAAISLTTIGDSGASTYSSGVLNIPTYTLAGLGGAAAATTITINGTAQDLSASRTFSVGTVTSVSGTGTVSGLTLTGSITNSGSLTLGGTLTLTSGNVTTALGFTPYNSTNPAGYTTNTGTVTSIVAGTYLTGGTITTSGTIAVDATTTNTADKIVARDASGNFSAGTITATLTGTASNATTLGTLSLQSAGAAPGANQVLRTDGSGYSYFGYINSSTGNAENPAISQIIVTNGSDNFYRKASLAHLTSAVQGAASGSWGISVTGNAATVGGLSIHTDRNNEVNKIVRTDANGYIQAGWINTTSGDNGTTAIDRIYASSDAYIRYYTPANFRTVLDVPTRTGGSASGTWAISVTGNAATATNVAYSGLTGTVPTWNQNTTGNAATASTSSQVTINYNNNSDASYQMLWGSGNSVYGTAGITCNPFTDTVNLTGTLNSAGLGVVGFGRMYGGDFWHSGTANNGTRTPTLKLGRFSDSETPAYIVYTNDTDTDTLEFFSERYAGDFRLTRNSETGLRNMMRVNSDNNGTVLDLYTGDGSTLGVKLQSNGDARFAYDVVAYYSFSDARLKTNVATIENPLQKVMAMRGVSYEWNEGYKIGKKEIGLIAQEVMEIIPEVVAEKERVDGSKFLSVDYEHLTGLLIEAVKELKREVDELKSK